MYCFSLDSQLQPEETGGKAFNLSEMKRSFFPVPRGFVIGNRAFAEFYEPGAEAMTALDVEISRFIAEIGAAKYMVRSSAVGEDSVQGSFAGQLESFISGASPEELRKNIYRCWQSYYKENVRVYQEQTGVGLKGMGVIIQELIEPDFAGVLFTRSFVKDDSMLCEYVQGHGEKLVSGEENPGRFHYRRSDGMADATVPFGGRDLYKLGLKLEQLFGQPLDIEWAVREGTTYIVQARPITVLKSRPEIFWSNTNVNENYPGPITPLLYSIARESYYHYFKNLSLLLQVPAASVRRLEADYANIIGIFGCRMYYNMSSIRNIIAQSPFASLLQKSFDDFVGYREESGKQKKSRLRNALRFIGSFGRLNRSLEKNVEEFEKAADSFHQRTLEAHSLSEYRECFHEFIELRMHSWYKASLADFFAMVYHGLLGSFCRRYFPEKHQGIHNTVIQAIPDLISSKPVTETWKIAEIIRRDPAALELLNSSTAQDFLQAISTNKKFAEIKSAIDKYLKDWGFRCSGELMFTETNFCEDPAKFIELLRAYAAQTQEDPERLIGSRNGERKDIMRQLRRELLRKRHLLFPLALAEITAFQLLVRLCFHGIASRERVRLKQALVYYRFKTIALKIGKEFAAQGLIGEAEDIYFLRYQEITENLAGSDMLPQQLMDSIRIRKGQFEKNSRLAYPDDFSSFLGEYPSPDRIIPKKKTAGGKGIQGLSACGGYVRGRVRVLESVMELHKIRKGDILVTRQTDPGWASIFPLISGLIVERGGMLSHGAIVAREFGIPAIVGVDNATGIFSDGEEIEIFADRGEVYRNVPDTQIHQAAL